MNEESKKLIKQVAGVYLECVRLNHGIAEVTSEKILHSIHQIYLLLTAWVNDAIGKRFGETPYSRWKLQKAEFEIKVCNIIILVMEFYI